MNFATVNVSSMKITIQYEANAICFAKIVFIFNYSAPYIWTLQRDSKINPVDYFEFVFENPRVEWH